MVGSLSGFCKGRCCGDPSLFFHASGISLGNGMSCRRHILRRPVSGMLYRLATMCMGSAHTWRYKSVRLMGIGSFVIAVSISYVTETLQFALGNLCREILRRKNTGEWKHTDSYRNEHGKPGGLIIGLASFLVSTRQATQEKRLYSSLL